MRCAGGRGRPIRVTHLVTDLSRGGAQVMLFQLLSAMDPSRISCTVISMTDLGPLAQKIQGLGIPVHALGMTRGRPDFRIATRLIRMLRVSRPDVLQTWLYHADLLGALAAPLAGSVPFVWGIHHTTLEHAKRLTHLIVKVNAVLSRFLPERIVFCAQSAADLHRGYGYDMRRMALIANGFSIPVEGRRAASRAAIRAELSIPEDAVVVGRFGRFHASKDYPAFVAAARAVGARRPNAHFLMCGDGVTADNPLVAPDAAIRELGSRLHILGPRDDIPDVCCALDIGVSSSASGEAFPMVIGEAMASGVPCVVTDVGDSAWLVGPTGRVVPPRDARALASAIDELAGADQSQRLELGRAARERIAERFSLDRAVANYSSLYEQVTASRGAVAGS